MVKIRFKLYVVLLSLLLIFGSVFADSAHAQEAQEDAGSPTDAVQLETITVTSEKREKDVQTIPSSVTVVDEIQIEDFELKNTLDLASMTPNLYFIRTSSNIQPVLTTMRGVGSGSDQKMTMGVYVDDVPYYGLDFSLYDIERIEVLRGPQGTLYGRNAQAGVINIVTQKPSTGWESKLRLDGGSFNSYGLNGTVSGPILGDQLGVRAAVNYFESDGYFENQYDGFDEAGREENLDGRFTFTSAPADKLDLTLTVDFQDYDSPQYAHYSPLDGGDLRKAVNVDYPGEANKDSKGASLRAEYQFSKMKLVSITAARNENVFSSNDVDFTPIDLMTFDWEIDATTYTQELRLVSDRPDSSFQWLAGLFLLNEEDKQDDSYWMNFMNMGYGVQGETLYFGTEKETLDTALFGEVTYRFAIGLDLTLGLRYEREQLDFESYQQPSGSTLVMMGSPACYVTNDETFEAWLPKFALNYHLTEGVMPYFIISRGYRSGGFNTTIIEAGTPYDPEFSWNYELGAKTYWWDNKLRLNAALFYIERSDMLVDVTAGDGYSTYIDNAAEASSKGFEVELMVRPVKELQLVAGAAYTDAKFDEYTTEDQVFDGNHVINSPEYTFNLGATYRHSSGFFLNANYNHIRKIYFDAENTQSQGDYGLFDAKIGYEAGHFDIYLYAQNLFDEEYVTRAFETSGVWYGRAGAPQSFGIVLQGRF